MVPVLIIRVQLLKTPVKIGMICYPLNLTRRLDPVPWYTSGFK